MINSLKGKLLKKLPTEIIVDVNNVGYLVHIPISTFEKLPQLNSEIFIYTHLIVREDAHLLFGFFSEEELEMFKLLITVSGIGPKIAQTILSGSPTNQIKYFISSGDISSLTSTPGIGRKTAERLIVELREKISKVVTTSKIDSTPTLRIEAINALVSLGYNRMKAEQITSKVLLNNNSENLTIENLLKESLQLLSKERS